jgi:hypothetical protein
VRLGRSGKLPDDSGTGMAVTDLREAPPAPSVECPENRYDTNWELVTLELAPQDDAAQCCEPSQKTGSRYRSAST